jgi:hypothetical protein
MNSAILNEASNKERDLAYDLPVNEWLLIPHYFRPNYYVPSICRKFINHCIRPVGWSVEVVESLNGGLKNETRIIKPNQVSMIIDLVPGYFRCVTITSNNIDKNKMYDRKSYSDLYKMGNAKIWHIWTSNLFLDSYEVYNSPPIDLTS